MTKVLHKIRNLHVVTKGSTCNELSYLILKIQHVDKYKTIEYKNIAYPKWGHRVRDRMVVGFTSIYSIAAYHH